MPPVAQDTVDYVITDDSGNDISKTSATVITVTTLPRDRIPLPFTVKDLGSPVFGTILELDPVLVDVKINFAETGAVVQSFTLGNQKKAVIAFGGDDLTNDSDGYVGIDIGRRSSGAYYIQLAAGNSGGGGVADTLNGISLGVDYYLKLWRDVVTGSANLDIYTDPARTVGNRIAQLSVASTVTATFSFSFWQNGRFSTTTKLITATISNLILPGDISGSEVLVGGGLGGDKVLMEDKLGGMFGGF